MEELKNDDAVAVGRFNPWNFSQQDRVFSAFFVTLSALIKHNDKSERAKEAAAWLDLVAGVCDTAGSATAAHPVVSLPAKIAGKYLKQLSKSATQFAEIWGELDARKEAISRCFKEGKKRYVLIIDDIDRLTHSEIRQVFQLVKSFADFDNLIYILVFDRSIVAHAFNDSTGDKGQSYLEKIINLQINIPIVTNRQIRKLLMEEIERYSKRYPSYNWQNSRLSKIFETAIKGFSTVRHIERFANALIIFEPLLENDIDHTDQIGLTILKIIEPSIYEFIGQNDTLFVDDVSNQLLRHDEQDKVDKCIIDEALKQARVFSSEEITSLLDEIFPKIKRIYSNYGNGLDPVSRTQVRHWRTIFFKECSWERNLGSTTMLSSGKRCIGSHTSVYQSRN